MTLGGSIRQSGVSSTSAVLVTNSSGTVAFSLDTINSRAVIGGQVSVYSTTNSVDTSSGSILARGGLAIQKDVYVGGKSYFLDDIDMNGKVITNSGQPLSEYDLATKGYVDLVVQGLNLKESVVAATTMVHTLSSDFVNGSTIDSVVLTTGDRILVKNQADPIENGIYIVQATAGVPSRSADLGIGSSASGAFVYVLEGDANDSTGWVCNAPSGDDIVGTDPLTFVQFTSLGVVEPGDGIGKIFNEIFVKVDDSSIEIIGDELRVKNTLAGTGLTGGSGAPLQTTPDQSHVTQVGVLTSGTWNASIVQVPYGGTGASEFSTGSVLFGNGVQRISETASFRFDSTASHLGIGSSSPSSALHIQNPLDAELVLHADYNETQPTVHSSIIFKHGTVQNGISVARSNDDYAQGVYENSLIIFTNDAPLQLVSNNTVHLTVMTSGNVGINDTSPASKLSVGGDAFISGDVLFGSTTGVISASTGALVVSGGIGVGESMVVAGNMTVGASIINGNLAVTSTMDSTGITNGSLVVGGGAAFGLKVHIGTDLDILENVLVHGTTLSDSSSSGALVVVGGVGIGCTENTASLENGGGLTLAGGISVAKDMRVGGDMYVYSDLLFTNTSGNVMTSLTVDPSTRDTRLFVYDSMGATTANVLSITNSTNSIDVFSNTVFHQGITSTNVNVSGTLETNGLIYGQGGSFTRIENTSTSANLWTYLGTVTDIKSKFDVSGLFVSLQDNEGILEARHSIRDDAYVTCIVYQDLGSVYHVFLSSDPGTLCNLHIQDSDVFVPVGEGTGASPDGTTSGYTGSWTLAFTSTSDTSTKSSIGSLHVNDSFMTKDTLPIIGSGSEVSGAIGVLNELYIPDVVSGTSELNDTIPSQLALTDTQIKLSSGASAVDNAYIGWYIEITSGAASGQVRRIVSYNGSLRLIGLHLSVVGVTEGDTVSLYNKTHSTLYYDPVTLANRLAFVSTDYETIDEHALGNLVLNSATLGTVQIVSTIDSTSAITPTGSIMTDGGVYVAKSAVVKQSIGIGNTIGNLPAMLSLHSTASSMRMSHTTGSYSFIDFYQDNSSTRFGLVVDGSSGQMKLTHSSTSQTPNLGSSVMCLTTSRKVGINTTRNINGDLTLNSNGVISMAADSSLSLYSGIMSSSGSRVVLFSNTQGGHADVYSSSTNGNIRFYTNGINRANILSSGKVTMACTDLSTTSTGALVLSGGVCIQATTNATSVTTGNALSVAGGTSVAKDLYVGGNIVVTGSVVSLEATSSPTIVFSNTVNATIVTQTNSRLVVVNDQAILSFYVQILPGSESINTEFQFDLPERVATLSSRGDAIVSCSGWTDNTSLIPLFNVLGTGVNATTRAVVKFQSVSAVSHYITVIARYSVL